MCADDALGVLRESVRPNAASIMLRTIVLVLMASGVISYDPVLILKTLYSRELLRLRGSG